MGVEGVELLRGWNGFGWTRFERLFQVKFFFCVLTYISSIRSEANGGIMINEGRGGRWFYLMSRWFCSRLASVMSKLCDAFCAGSDTSLLGEGRDLYQQIS